MKDREKMIMRELDLLPLYQQRQSEDDNVSKPLMRSNDALPAEQSEIEISRSFDDISTSAPNVDRRQVILKMQWPELKTTVSGCEACRLHTTRKNTVFGVGDENASWLFVGEGPGADEDRQGEPFVGQAGKLLDNMLAAIDLRRGNDVYIANIVKCRPPGNRNPETDEANSCEPYLTRQIELIKPKLIVALGKTAVQNLLGTNAAIGSLRGRLHQYKNIPLLVTYHPAYLLRNLPDKAKAWEDLCLARATMANLKSVIAPT